MVRIRHALLLIGVALFASLMPAYALADGGPPAVRIGASSTSQDVAVGGSATFNITANVATILGNGTTSFSAIQVPDGVIVTFNPNPAKFSTETWPQSSTIMTVKVAEDIPPDTTITFSVTGKVIIYKPFSKSVDFTVDKQLPVSIALNVKRSITVTSTVTATLTKTSTYITSLTSTTRSTITVISTVPDQTLTTTVTNTASSITSVIVKETSTVTSGIRESDAWSYSPIGAGIALAGLFIAVAIFRRR